MGQFLYTILGFTLLFVFLLTLYGASAGIPEVTGPMNVLTAPWPKFFIGSCSAAVFCVNQVGDFLTSFQALGFTALLKLGAVFALFYGIFAILNSYSGFPFVGWFFSFLMIIIAIESFKIWRSGHTA